MGSDDSEFQGKLRNYSSLSYKISYLTFFAQ